MDGIAKECARFVSAILDGVLVASTYLILYVFREIIPHKLWTIHIEDGLYWCGVTAYLFVQIYYTNNGNLRWYDVLGLVFGVIIMALILPKLKKISGKILRTNPEKELRNSKKEDKIKDTKIG